MFRRKDRPKYQGEIEDEIERVVSDLKFNQTNDDYAKKLALAERLHALLDIHQKPARISPDTRATIVANLVGILMILKHEHVNNITSKALSFVIKPRI